MTDSTSPTMQKPVLPRLSLPYSSQYPPLTCLSTSSRPSGAGLGGSPTYRAVPHYRHLSPPAQPPPLPPPPPSPQLTPLKARSARSKSVSGLVGHPSRSPSAFTTATSVFERRKPLTDRGGHKHQGICGATDRGVPGDGNIRNAFDRYPQEPELYRSKIGCQSVFEFASHDGHSSIGGTAVSLPTTVPPTAFSTITHPRDRSAISVCLVSAAFLSASVIGTTILSIILLPLVLFACMIRQIVYWFSNVLLQHFNVCCQCGRSQPMTANNWSLLRVLSLGQSSETDAPQCHCVMHHSTHAPVASTRPGFIQCCSGKTFRPLSAAELRWLSSGAISAQGILQRQTLQTGIQPDLAHATVEPQLLPLKSPVIVICLRFGAPGISLSRLRDLIARRLLTLQRHCSSSHPSSLTSSPRSSSFSDKWLFFGDSSTISSGQPSHRTPSPQQRSNSLIPPSDTASRLTQCLVCLPTGYGWRDCLAFRLDEHVVKVPSEELPGENVTETNDESDHRPERSRGRLIRSSLVITPTGKRADRKTNKAKPDDSLPPPVVDVEELVTRLSRIPFQHNRPLWQAHLVERYQENESSAEMLSDADSGVEESQGGFGVSGSGTGIGSVSKVYTRPGRSRRHSGANPAKASSELKPPRSSSSSSSSAAVVVRPMVSHRAPPLSTGQGAAATATIRRVGGAGVGSLLVFRLHAAVSDDARAVVQLLTNCLADNKSSSGSSPPARSPAMGAPIDCHLGSASPAVGGLQQRWRGQRQETPRGTCRADESEKSTNYAVNGSERSFPSPGLVPPNVNRSYLTVCPPSTVTTTTSSSNSCLPLSGDRPSSSVIGGFAPNRTTISSSRLNEKPELHTSALHGPPSTSPSPLPPSIDSNDDEVEELATAQWWYSFWSSSLATIATACDLIRALVTGPIIVLHKYLFTRADMGVLAIVRHTVASSAAAYLPHRQSNATTTTGNSSVNTEAWALDQAGTRPVAYRCTLLPLLKLSRIRQVTKASYSEIVLSLLAGGLRAYHQNIGVQHPPDLLAILSTEVPALPNCSIRSLEQTVYGRARHLTSRWSANSGAASLSGGRHSQIMSNSCVGQESCSAAAGQQAAREHLLESGLLLADGQPRTAVPSQPPPPAANTNTLRPGRYVLVDVCLPLNTEGMLPRLWETRQRLVELSRSIEPLCLAWARSIIYTVMPHSLADWLEARLGSSAKASVHVASIDVVSPFSQQHQSKVDESAVASSSYQMPAVRRLAYMSLLASKSAEARSLRRRRLLHKRLPRSDLLRLGCPPRLGTSFRAMARHLANANAGLVYVAGSPIVRIDTWMPSARRGDGDGVAKQQRCQQYVTSLGISTNGSAETAVSSMCADNWLVCRDLSVTFTTYAGQLSLTLSGDAAMDGVQPNLDLIIQAMHIQLRKMYRLLAGRYLPTAPDRWLHCQPQWDTGEFNRSIQNSNGRTEQARASATDADYSTTTTINSKEHEPPGSLPRSQSNMVISKGESFTKVDHQRRAPKGGQIQSKYLPNVKKVLSMGSVTTLSKNGKYSVDETGTEYHTSVRQTNLSEVRCEQPTEQLQDRLRWVQQQLMESAVNPSQTANACTSQTSIPPDRLAALRSEFSTLLRELKQRCSLGSLGISPDFQPVFEVHGPEQTSHSSAHYASSTTVTLLSRCVIQDSAREKAIIHERPDGTQSTTEVLGYSIGHSVAVEYNGNSKHLAFIVSGGDFDEDPDFHIHGCSEEDEEFGFEHPTLVVDSQHTSRTSHYGRSRTTGKIKRKRSSSLLQLPSVAIANLDLKPGRRGSLGTTTTTTTSAPATAVTTACTPTGGGILAKIAKLTTPGSSETPLPTTCSSSLTVRLSR